MNCLFKEGEDTSDYVKAEGIMTTVGFHPERLEDNRGQIAALLDELPIEFTASSEEGGMSFLNACYDRHGEQWTSLHERMDQLFQLGKAIGRVECHMPREAWHVLPGGVPHYTILSK